MTVTLVPVLFVGGALFATGAFTVAYRRSFPGALAGLPLLLGGAGLDLVGVSRFATSSADRVAGQEFAVVLAGLTLAAVAAGAALARPPAPLRRPARAALSTSTSTPTALCPGPRRSCSSPPLRSSA